MTRPAVAVILDLARVMQSQREYEVREAYIAGRLQPEFNIGPWMHRLDEWRRLRAERWLEEGRGGL